METVNLIFSIIWVIYSMIISCGVLLIWALIGIFGGNMEFSFNIDFKKHFKKKNMKQIITFNELSEIEAKLEIKIGVIEEVERVPKSTKLLKLLVDFGSEKRTAITNLGGNLSDLEIISYFKNEKFPFIMNLTPTKIMGIESTAMIMVGTSLSGEIEFSNYSPGSKLF